MIRTTDNRNMAEMETLYLARIEALKMHISRLEDDLEFAQQLILDREYMLEHLREQLKFAESMTSF